MHRMLAYGVSALLLGLVLAPAFREPWAQDSFPLSTYPMFSQTRPREMRVAHAVAVRSDGERAPVPPQLVAGTSEVLQSMAVVRRALRQGERRQRRLCRRIARRVERTEVAELGGARRIELSVDRFDTVAYFEEAAEPLERRVFARCPVEGHR